jgi:ribonuclease P protein component
MKAPARFQKLLNREQFRKVYDQGQKFHTPFFSAFILKTDSGEQRVGITVTRKLGGAVVRNRCKRRIREILRRQLPSLANDVGYDIVINAKASLPTADFQQLAAAFERTLARLREPYLKSRGGKCL